MTEQTIQSTCAYQGKLINLRVDTVRLADGRVTQREIVEHPGAVGILAIDDHGDLLLVRQYRKAIERATLEIPAGTRGPGEAALACAERELREETGREAREMRPMLGYYPSAGFCDEHLQLFCARDLTYVGGTTDEDESVEVVVVSPQSAWHMVERGEIVDGKTIIALLWLTLQNNAATA